jgi:hypothetical protein
MRPERYFGFRDIAPDTPFDTPFGRRSNLPAILRYKTALIFSISLRFVSSITSQYRSIVTAKDE